MRKILTILLILPISLFSINEDDILSEITNTTNEKDFIVVDNLSADSYGLGSTFKNSFEGEGITFGIDGEYNRIHSIIIENENVELYRGLKLGVDLFTVTTSRSDVYELILKDDGKIEGVTYRFNANPYEEFIQTFYVDSTNRVNRVELIVNSPRYSSISIDRVLDIKPLREIDFVLFDSEGKRVKWDNEYTIKDERQYTYRGIRLGSLDITIKGMHRDKDASIEVLSEEKYNISYSYSDDDHLYTIVYHLTDNRVSDIKLTKSVL